MHDATQFDWSGFAAAVTAIGGLVTAIGVILIGYWSYKAKQIGEHNAIGIKIASDHAGTMADKLQENTELTQQGIDKVADVKETINGRMEDLLEAARKIGYGQGQSDAMQAKGCTVMEEKKNGGPKPPEAKPGG